ncbi:MAG: PilZ domain-containing protein [Terriglobia bacterium]
MSPKEPPPAPRPLTGIEVEFSCAGVRGHAKGNLLGVGALLLLTEQRAPEATEVALRFRPTPQSPLMSARGVVSRQVPGEGLGVRITELAEEHRRHILELLYPPGAERRASKRILLVTQIRTVVGGRTIVGYSKNISTGGMFIETEMPAEKGSELVMRFKLNPEGEILETRAVVAYCLPGEGMGLRFVDLAAQTHQRIEAFVNEQEG